MSARWPIRSMPAKAYGDPFGAGRPRGVVIHCTESDNVPTMAENLSGPGWFGGSKAGTSVHRVTDVDSIVQGVDQGRVAYGVGAKGNGLYRQYEMCGRAGWSAEKWREPAQLAMLRGAAPFIADDLREMGSRPRWLSLAQVARGEVGMLTHNDVRLALGGTTHSDPGPNFPYAELLQYVTEAYDGTTTPAQPAPVNRNEEDDDVKTIVLVGIKGGGPDWEGWWVANLADHTRYRLSSQAQVDMVRGQGVTEHRDQAPVLLDRFRVIDGL